MIKSVQESPLYRIADPRSVAFFGASNNITSMGTNQIRALLDLGYEGKVYPVHPREDTVQGLKAYRSVLDLPEAPDLAVLVLPTKVVPEVMDQCGRRGIKQAVVVSGGFGEAGEDGVALQERLSEAAERHGIRYLGPNCLGVAALHNKVNTTFLPCEGSAGFIGMASQSGSFVTQMFDYLDHYGLGFSVALSVGNEADIDLVDVLEYLAVDPQTKVIAMYVESLRRGRRFLEAARAITPHKPIVAFYVGGSEAGRRAGLSHTGALAGPDRLYDGIFRQAGIIRAHSIEQLFDFSWALGACRPPAGERVIIQTHSGGPGATAADACGRAGLELPLPSQASLDALADLVPHTGTIGNPIDVTYTRNPLEYLMDMPRILLADENYDGMLFYYLMPDGAVNRAMIAMGIPSEQAQEQAGILIREQAGRVSKLIAGAGKPLIGFSFRSRGDMFIRELQDQGVVVMPSGERAAAAMAALLDYGRLRAKILGTKS